MKSLGMGLAAVALCLGVTVYAANEITIADASDQVCVAPDSGADQEGVDICIPENADKKSS